MAEVLRTISAQLADCEAEVASLEAKGGADKAKVELADGRLRGLGFGHEVSRLTVVDASEGAALSTAQLHAGQAAAYTFVDDVAGRWMAETARLANLRQRQRELLGE